jgi:hypothetical protein
MHENQQPFTGLYNTNGLPPFDVPHSTKDARERIIQLTSAVASIDDQCKYREISDTLDPEWFKRAMTSKRFKSLEMQRLQAWLDDRLDSGAMTLDEAVLTVVRGDYTDSEWDSVVREARGLVAQNQ